jgi:hypothetical protein
LVDSRKTVNDRFPMSYTYLCRWGQDCLMN